MEKKDRQENILQQAIEIFRETTGVTAEILPGAPLDTNHRNAKIRINFQEKAHDFVPEIKIVLTRTTVGATIQQLRKEVPNPLLITQYVTPPIADLLKEMDMPFMDAAGNAYLNDPPLYIFVKGNKPAEKDRREPLTRAFQPAGLRVIYAILCKPGMENTPYRHIAAAAGVALGTIGWVMEDLKRMGHLMDMGAKGRRLLHRDQLLARWVTTYPDQLRPRLIMGRYQVEEGTWWEKVEIQDFHALWGGEVAAAQLTGYLKPQIITIYTNKPLGELLLKYRLIKNPRGNVEMLNMFWNFDYGGLHKHLVPPILIYADLLATGDARNIETARIIYDREIAKIVRED
jgi:hypothetical protein